MSVQCPVQLQWNPFVGFSLHDGLVLVPPAPPLPVPMLPHIAASVLNGLWFFSEPSKGNKSGDVLADGLPMMGAGSDAGLFVPHVSIPPNNVLLPLTTVLGSSYSFLRGSSVMLPCHNLLWGDSTCSTAVSLPMSFIGLNLACWDICPLPTDMVVTWSTVMVGMSTADLLASLIDVAEQMALALVMHFGMAKLGKSARLRQVAEEAGDAAGKPFRKIYAALAPTKLDDLVKVARRGALEGLEDEMKAAMRKAIKEGGETDMDEALLKGKREAEALAKKAGKKADEAEAAARKRFFRSKLDADVEKARKEAMRKAIAEGEGTIDEIDLKGKQEADVLAKEAGKKADEAEAALRKAYYQAKIDAATARRARSTSEALREIQDVAANRALQRKMRASSDLALGLKYGLKLPLKAGYSKLFWDGFVQHGNLFGGGNQGTGAIGIGGTSDPRKPVEGWVLR